MDDLRGLESLRGAWEEVARESGQTSPFLSHGWFACCWRAATGRRPEVLVVEDAAGPVGLVPLALSDGRLRGLPVRWASMLDAPDTPFVDWLIAGQPDRVVEAVLEHLAGRRDWDVLCLNGLPASSAALKALDATLPERFASERRVPTRAPFVDLRGGWDAYWAGKSQRFKKTVRHVRNRIERAGRLALEEHREVGTNTAALAEALDVSRRSWKAAERLAMATMPGMPEFFRELTEHATARGWLRLWLLRLDGRAVAAEYQIEDAGHVYALRADFDGSLADELSPGSYLNDEIVRRLFGQPGLTEYDMGPGVTEYKTRWATGMHEAIRLWVYHRRPRGAALRVVETLVVPGLKGARRLLGSRA